MNGTFAAAILAGGKSKRFGSDKAFHKIQNATLWEDQVEKVSQLMPSEIIISSNENQSFNTPHKIIVDSVKDQGPLRGIVDILNATKADRILILAVDLPKISINFLGELIYAGCGTVPVHKNGMTEPLAAVYPRSMLPLAERNLSLKKFKMQDVVHEGIQERFLKERPIGDSELHFFENLNYQNNG